VKSLGDRVEFSVEDTGCGIAAADLPLVFDRFWRKKTAGTSGAGLGLAVVKGLVEAHGGAVWIESEEGKGIKFFFTLPVPTALDLAATPEDISPTRH
jgi:signal transduction histidine kinase